MKLLFVEDSQFLQDSVTKILANGGYDVVSAYNGLEALKILEKRNFDLVLMDLYMPGLNGLETAQIITKQSGFKPKIIIMTGSTIDIDSYKEVGVISYLYKPFSLLELKNILRKWQPINQQNRQKLIYQV